MDPTTAGLIAISTIVAGVTAKILFELRKNVKNCWGIQFRSPQHSEQEFTTQPHITHQPSISNNIEMTTIHPTIPTLPIHNENYQ